MIEQMVHSRRSEREAVECEFLDGSGDVYKVGYGDVCAITVYREDYGSGCVPWVRVLTDKGREHRFPAKYALLTFESETTNEDS